MKRGFQNVTLALGSVIVVCLTLEPILYVVHYGFTWSRPAWSRTQRLNRKYVMRFDAGRRATFQASPGGRVIPEGFSTRSVAQPGPVRSRVSTERRNDRFEYSTEAEAGFWSGVPFQMTPNRSSRMTAKWRD